MIKKRPLTGEAPATRMTTAQGTSACRCFLPNLAELGGVHSHGSWLQGFYMIPEKGGNDKGAPAFPMSRHVPPDKLYLKGELAVYGYGDTTKCTQAWGNRRKHSFMPMQQKKSKNILTVRENVLYYYVGDDYVYKINLKY